MIMTDDLKNDLPDSPQVPEIPPLEIEPEDSSDCKLHQTTINCPLI
jgi:hypothetical protein